MTAASRYDRYCQRREREILAVDRRDHKQCDDVVDDDDGEHERTETVGEARSDERQHAEARTRCRSTSPLPSRQRSMPGIDRQVDRDGHRHPRQPSEERQRKPLPVPQVAEIELTPRLEATTKKNKVIRPLFTQPRTSCASAASPRGSYRGLPQPVVGRAGRRSPRSTPRSLRRGGCNALPVSVRRNSRNGVHRLRSTPCSRRTPLAGRDSVIGPSRCASHARASG